MATGRRLTLVWVVLLVITFGSFLIGIEQSPSFASAGAVLIIGLALVKVRLVGLHFMDVRSAPPVLRMVFEGYVLAVLAALVALDVLVGP